MHFFKIITTPSLEAGNLKIPNGFTRKYGGDMPNPVSIKPPDGTKWKLHWSEHDSGIFFHKGFKEFTKYYSLDHGHMLLFEYKDTSHFGVHIFHKSALEIEYPKHENQDELNNPDQTGDGSAEILHEIPSCNKSKRKSPNSCPQPRKKPRTGTSEGVGRIPKLRKPVQIEEDAAEDDDDPVEVFNEIPPCKKTNLKSQKSCSTRTAEYVGRIPKLETLLKQVQIECEQSQDGVSGTTERHKGEHLPLKVTQALNKARAIRSINPSFMVVMKPSYMYTLHVSSQFASKYLKKRRGILLQVLDGRTWTVSYNLRKIYAGWRQFVSDNKLKVGDVCRFELIKKESFSLKVLIFPVAEEPHLPRSLGGRATQRDSNGALNEANEFTSENPFFSVTMQSDRRFRPAVPSAFMKKHLNEKKSVMLQFGKNLWPVKLLYSRGDRKYARLSTGWTVFAGECGLVAGDVCVFELINKEDTVLDAHIYRDH